MATFPNPGGLDRQGNNYFDLDRPVRLAQYRSRLERRPAGRSSRVAWSRQMWITAAEFTQLIVAQRGFQVNAETISVSSQVLETLANIIR